MNHRAEIRFPPHSQGKAPADPSSIVVNHHRVEHAELSTGMLSGGHLFHLALAGCIFNNIFRLATERGIDIQSVRVTADGDFDDEGSSGVACEIDVIGGATEEELRKLAKDANTESAIGVAIRKGAKVTLEEVRTTRS